MPVLCLCVVARKAIGTKSFMKLYPFLHLLTLNLGDLDILLCLLEQRWQEMFSAQAGPVLWAPEECDYKS